MNELIKIPTKDMSREDWLAERRKSIGGSDAAAIVGLSKWSSPYSVWADKTGRLPEKEETEAMRLGTDLEQYVAQRWSEQTGKKVAKSNYILKNPAYPFAHANIDRTVHGERAGLECKTTSTLDVKQFNDVEFPEQYYAQCVHYLAVTGWDKWYLAVLCYGRGFFTFELKRDEAEIKALMDAEAAFWENVINDTPPAVDGSEATTEALTTIYAESAPGTVELFGREQLIDEYETIKRQLRALSERRDEIENILKTDLGDNERGLCGRWTVSWKSQTRSTLNAKALQADHPEYNLAPYYKTTAVRPFKVTMKNNDK